MVYFSENEILKLFSILNNKIEYMLLRNIDNELPSKLSKTKDIDIIVKESSSVILNRSLLENGWKRVTHPYSKTPFLYGIKPFVFYNKNGLHLDVCFQLPCRSLNKGEWFPLHMKIQDNIWGGIRTVEEPLKTFMLSYEDEFVHLMTRCFLDKRVFTEGYIRRIEFLFLKIDKKLTQEKLELVFYKYTNTLLEMIKNRKYNNLAQHYLQFKDY